MAELTITRTKTELLAENEFIFVHPTTFANIQKQKKYDAYVKIVYNNKKVYRKMVGLNIVSGDEIVMANRTITELGADANAEVKVKSSNWFMYNLHNSKKSGCCL